MTQCFMVRDSLEDTLRCSQDIRLAFVEISLSWLEPPRPREHGALPSVAGRSGLLPAKCIDLMNIKDIMEIASKIRQRAGWIWAGRRRGGGMGRGMMPPL